MIFSTCDKGFHKAHDREIEVITKRQCGEVYTAHSVSLVDVQQCALIFGKVGECVALSGFEVTTLREVARCVITDTEVTGCRCRNGYCRICTTSDTPGQNTAEEVSGLLVAVADAPTCTDECRKRSQPKTLQGVEVDSI